jgi:hypothetical protein
MIRLDLGQRRLLSRPCEELATLIGAANSQKIKDAGGCEAWEALSEKERTKLDRQMMHDLIIALGEDAYEGLSDTEKHNLDLFLWAGCCMHKELNSVKGGNSTMMAWWEANNRPPPILLANRDNASTLRNISSTSDTSTAAEQRAFETSTRGGVKACSLAGAIFNHKDDKKGQQELHRIYFENVKGYPTTFPNTSSIRYHCFCDAAAELVTYLPHYIAFLEVIRDKKKDRKLNHMEQNLYDALHDLSTLTELVVMTLYGGWVSKPYAAHVRGPGTENLNILDLGPLHDDLLTHIQHLIDQPKDILYPHELYSFKFLGKSQWHKSMAIDAALQLAITAKLSDLEPLLVTFLRGSLKTWERFTEEFETGGAIDGASSSDKDRAWMPSTNDANKGALGQLRTTLHNKPTMTMHIYNALAMFNRNNTQPFMDVMFNKADHTFIMQEARRVDSSGMEKKRKAEIREHDDRVVAAKCQKRDETARKRAAIEARINAVVLVLDLDEMNTLSVKDIDDQLAAHRAELDVLIPKKSALKVCSLYCIPGPTFLLTAKSTGGETCCFT